MLLDPIETAQVARAQAALRTLASSNDRDRLARNFIRGVIAKAIGFAKIDTREPAAIARGIWGDDVAAVVQRSVTGALTGAQTAEAVEFANLASGASLLGRLPIRRWAFDALTLSSGGIAAGEVDEGDATPLRVPSVSSFRLKPRKFQGAVLTTRDALQRGGERVEQGLQNDLIQGTADSIDTAFIADLVGAEDSNGFVGDHRFAIYLLHPGDAAKYADEKLNNRGGEYLGYPAFVSNTVAPGTAIFFDASRVFADWGDVAIDFASSATVEASDAPTTNSTTPTASTMISLWQTNSIVVRASLQAGWHIADGAVETVPLSGI